MEGLIMKNYLIDLWYALTHPIKLYIVICIEVLKPALVITIFSLWILAVIYVLWYYYFQ